MPKAGPSPILDKNGKPVPLPTVPGPIRDLSKLGQPAPEDTIYPSRFFTDPDTKQRLGFPMVSVVELNNQSLAAIAEVVYAKFVAASAEPVLSEDVVEGEAVEVTSDNPTDS